MYSFLIVKLSGGTYQKNMDKVKNGNMFFFKLFVYLCCTSARSCQSRMDDRNKLSFDILNLAFLSNWYLIETFASVLAFIKPVFFRLLTATFFLLLKL